LPISFITGIRLVLGGASFGTPFFLIYNTHPSGIRRQK